MEGATHTLAHQGRTKQIGSPEAARWEPRFCDRSEEIETRGSPITHRGGKTRLS